MQDQPLGIYTKQPTDQTGQSAMPAPVTTTGSATPVGAWQPNSSDSKKKLSRRTLAAVGVLALFFVLGGLGVVISLRQRLDQAPVAPNAPESRPSASETTSCTLSFVVPEPEVTPTPGVTPTPEVTPTPGVTPTPEVTPTPGVTPTPEVTPTPGVTPTPEVTPTPGVTPTPAVTPTPGVTPTPAVSPTPSTIALASPSPSPTPAIGCNDVCVNNSDCSNINHVCYNGRCRLGTNVTNTSCVNPSSPVPTPTPVVGCRDVCTSNSDCSNGDHICYQSECRLASNPENLTCSPASTSVAVVNPSSTPSQPQLPSELPQTGPEDWGNWLKVGLGVVVMGAVMLLFL